MRAILPNSPTESPMLDLQQFLRTYQKEHIHIRKPVKLDQVGTLVGQADDTIVFDHIEEHPGWHLVDLLFVNREAQARVLGCHPNEVVKCLAEVLRRGPKPLQEVHGGPCQEQIYLDDQIDLSTLPIVRHTEVDPYPSTGLVVHQDPETGQFNQMYARCGVLHRGEMVTSFVTSTANQILGKH